MNSKQALHRLLLQAMLRLPASLQIRLSGKDPIRIDGNRLEPSLQLLLSNETNFPQHEWQDMQVLRKQLSAASDEYALHSEPMASIREFRVAQCKVRVYQPLQHDNSALLYLHGGGWILGGLDASDRLSRYLAHHTASTVFSVDYRLAPEHPFPAACNDVLNTYRWLLENGEKFAISSDRVFIAGDSAGGNLASALSQDCYINHLRKPCGQILISPLLDPTSERPSRRLFAKGFGLSAEAIEFFLQCYVPNRADRCNPRVATLQQLHSIDTPPTLVISAGFDPLRDEAREYATILRQKSCAVEYIEYRSMVHGFYFFAGVCPKILGALNNSCQHIKRFKARLQG